MAELPITAAVGAGTSPNRPDDVRTVQDLLLRVQPPLAAHVAVTGVADRVTLDAIREFQHRFMANEDGIVTPDERTIWHLNDGAVPQYLALSSQQRSVVDHDIIQAQRWLSLVNSRLTNMFDQDMKQKVDNVFHIWPDNPFPPNAFGDLRARFLQLRQSFDQPFPLQYEPIESAFLAWVVPGDATGTMHFPKNYFRANPVERVEKIIHERAHTVFGIVHDGMASPAGDSVDFNPGDPNPYTRGQALNNAYCYGWLANALQPGYRPTIKPVHLRGR